MKTYLVSYATERFVPDQAMLMESAVRFGVTDPRPWSEEMLRATPFYSQHKSTLAMRRGAGYWLWKPFIVLETLKEMQEGDCLIYSDSGIEVIADLTPLLRVALETHGVMLFSGSGKCREWTKRDCFFLLGMDEPLYHEAQMLDASFMVLVKRPHACAFAAEWLDSCADSRVLTDEPNTCGLPNLPGFVDHRHDQSVLSLLAKRGNVELFRHPSQYGNQSKMPEYRVAGELKGSSYASQPDERSPYGTLLNHHRGRSRYIRSVELRRRVEARSNVQWMDQVAGRRERVRSGEVVVARMSGKRSQALPHLLVHDWIGAVFIPRVSVRDVFGVIRDYDRYADYYGPTIRDAKLLFRGGDLDSFRVRYLRNAVFVRVALDIEYEVRYSRLDEQRWYSVARSTSVREIQNYGEPGERTLAVDDGSGYVRISNFHESDGGVYIEQKSIALKRNIPVLLRWLVKPFVERSSRQLIIESLRQTRDAVLSLGVRIDKGSESPEEMLGTRSSPKGISI